MPSVIDTAGAETPTEDELVRVNLPIVQHAVAGIAGRVPRHVGRDDLLSAGMAGLAQAARSFDPERAGSFPRFASARIKGAILDELRSQDWASRSVRAKARQMTAAGDRLTGRLGRAPSQEELASEMGVDSVEVDAINRDVHRSVVLNLEGITSDSPTDDVIAGSDAGPDSILLERERHAYLVAAVAHLPERLRRVVMGYFFEELPMHVLADELGVTDSRISQMRAEALVLLKTAIDAQLEPAPPVTSLDASRSARRRASYVGAVAAHHDYRRRLDPESATLASLVTAAST
jgi:RNA polymerase sigma factor for flagellar operon FliA